MHIVVSARHANITDDMKSYAEKKAAKLPKYYDRVQEIEVVLDYQALRHRVEIIVNAEHKNMFVASEVDDDFYAAADLALDKISQQLTRHKDKHRNRKHPSASGDRSAESV